MKWVTVLSCLVTIAVGTYTHTHLAGALKGMSHEMDFAFDDMYG